MDNSSLLQILGQVSSDQAAEVFRQHLRGAVLEMISDVMAEEVTSLCGEKHRPSEDVCFRSGSSSGRVIYEGERDEIVRPSVRQLHADGSTSEVQLETYRAASKPAQLKASIVDALVAGVSTRTKKGSRYRYRSFKRLGFKCIVGKGCFVAGPPVHVAALPNGFQQSLLVSTRLQPTKQQSFHLADSLDQTLLVSKSGEDESKSHARQIPTQSLLVADESNRSAHLVAIEDVPLGALISAKNPDGSGFDVEMGDADDWIRIELEFEREEGSTVRIETLRRKTDFGHLRVGAVVPLQTSEADLSGMATVLAVDSDFELAVGEGNAVTARYRTSEVDLIARVTLDSGDVVSGSTKHTIWSVSRRSFVEMAELQVDELVDTELGVASVQCVEVINEPQAVYNLEIAGQHVFRIGKTGVLVHNAEESYKKLADKIENARNSSIAGDRLEGEVAFHLGSRVQHFQRPVVIRKVTGKIKHKGDVDIEIREAIIEVANGKKAGGKEAQLQLRLKGFLYNPLGKPVIIFAPNFKPRTVNALLEGGAHAVVKTFDELDDVLKGLL